MKFANSLVPERAMPSPEKLTHLEQLEAESIHIIREVAAECEKPVMLYSIGKDSAVMLHLAMKAFYPAKPPFPLLHVDTTWKFRDMIDFRDQTAQKLGLDLIVHINPDGRRARTSIPSTTARPSTPHIMKTEALKQALDKYGFDAAFGGARRDEEKSRAKERIFSFRDARHRWDPKNQRPELWSLYNARKNKGESDPRLPACPTGPSSTSGNTSTARTSRSCRSISPAERPVVERDGQMIMVDDERMPLRSGREAARCAWSASARSAAIR